MYYSAIGLLAVFILLIENGDILPAARGAFEKPAWKVYRRFLFAVLAYYVTDILWGFLESRKLSALLFTDTTVYFMAMAAGVLFWAEFTVTYLGEKNEFGQMLVSAGRFIAGLITLLAMLNIVEPTLFSVDADCVYHTLPLRYAVLVVQILLLLLISGYAFYNLRLHTANRGKNRAVVLFGLIMALFLFVQLWFAYLPLYSIAYMLGTCLLHTFVINEEHEEYRRGMEETEKIRALNDTIVSLMDNMPAMTFTKDAKTGVYLACNQAFAEYAHKDTPAGVIGLAAEEIFDADTARQFTEEDRIALSMDEPYVFFEDVPDAAGNQRQLQTTKLKYTNFAGQLCVLGMCQDVTDMVRVQREDATSKEAYEKARSAGIIYTHTAQTLARGYTEILHVNLDSEEYIEYHVEENTGKLVEKRRGWHFFEVCSLDTEQFVYAEDCASVVKALERKTLEAELDRNRTFVMTFRMLKEGAPRYVNMNVSRSEDDGRWIILGVTDVDDQMKRRHAAVRAQEEQIAYARVKALIGDFLCIYIVDPKTGRYREFSATQSYEALAQDKEGMDFFAAVREAARRINHSEDLNRFLSTFTQENVMAEIGRHGIFTVSYRLMMEDQPRYVQLKAAIVQESEGDRLIVGINDIDAQVRQEETYVQRLAQARINASIDPLTGVKNRHAYLEAEARLNKQIAEQRAPEFAIVLLDVNDLKKVNDTAGHKAGDIYIKDACRIICDVFKHSPVFRIGGDEFAVISQGGDYARIDRLVARMSEHNRQASQNGGIIIACGMAKYEGDARTALVFERADRDMYGNKNRLKAEKKG